jgi:hypothetical protein
MNTSLQALLQGAKDEGLLTQAALNSIQVIDLGAAIQDNLGVIPAQIDATEVFGLFSVIDDSGSIRFAGNTDVVRQGYNSILEALMKSNARDDIIVTARLLNAGMLHAPCPLRDAKRLDQHFNPNGGTPLYDTVIEVCGLAAVKYQEFQMTGASFKGVIPIVTDGNDEGSTATADRCKPVVEALMAREIFTVMAMGIDDGRTDFRKVVRSMGIPDNLILTVSNDPHSIREAFGVVSRATASASQGGSVSKVGLGGFAQP